MIGESVEEAEAKRHQKWDGRETPAYLMWNKLNIWCGDVLFRDEAGREIFKREKIGERV